MKGFSAWCVCACVCPNNNEQMGHWGEYLLMTVSILFNAFVCGCIYQLEHIRTTKDKEKENGQTDRQTDLVQDI